MSGALSATDRLFFAVRPDAAAARRIDALAATLRERFALTGRPLGAARYHVTVAFLGDHAGVPPELLAQLQAAAGAVALPAFDVRFDQVASFERSRHSPLVLRGEGPGVAGLVALAGALRERLAPLGLAERRRFTPHLTLLRDDRVLRLQPVEPVAWHAREFALMCSRIGQGRHETLARWPLAESGENPRQREDSES